MAISVIKKRDGRIVPFDVQKISQAIQKSFLADAPDRDHKDRSDALAWEVYSLLDLEGDPAPTVEHVQDIVEQVLMRNGYVQTAKSYILYRQERTNIRNRDARGRGVVTLSPPSGETTFIAQALEVYAAVRDNGGCEQLVGFYPVMARGIADEFRREYANLFRLALRYTAQLRVSEETLEQIDRSLADIGLTPSLGESEAYCSRQIDYLCGVLGCDRAPAEQAQNMALPHARAILLKRIHRGVTTLLTHLEAAGCRVEQIAPEREDSAEIRLLREILQHSNEYL